LMILKANETSDSEYYNNITFAFSKTRKNSVLEILECCTGDKYIAA